MPDRNAAISRLVAGLVDDGELHAALNLLASEVGDVARKAGLTTAELRVAALLAAGATKRQAATRLFVSPHTVDTHLRAVYRKLGVRTRVELARAWDRVRQ